jgi:hypothetical protein
VGEGKAEGLGEGEGEALGELEGDGDGEGTMAAFCTVTVTLDEPTLPAISPAIAVMT